MSEDSAGEGAVDVPGTYYLCDYARKSREFALADRATGEIFESPTEEAVRTLAEQRYPGARFVLTSTRSVVLDEDLGQVVVMVVYQQQTSEAPWQAVASVSGSVHGPRCIPFSLEVWPDAVNGLVPPLNSSSSTAPPDPPVPASRE